jgi:hypothetical protein
MSRWRMLGEAQRKLSDDGWHSQPMRAEKITISARKQPTPKKRLILP